MRRSITVVVLCAGCGTDSDTSTPDGTAPDTHDSADLEIPTCPPCPISPSACITNECDPVRGVCTAVFASDGTPCDRDGDPATADECDTRGLCQPPEEPPPPVACGPLAATLTCGAVVTDEDGLSDTMRHYDCSAAPLPGGELVFAFTPNEDGVASIDVDAQPREYIRTLILSLTCDVGSCLGAPADDPSSSTFPVEAGHDYFVVIDATVGGVVELESLTLTCSGGEVCDNHGDDDFDTYADCADPDCGGRAPCEAPETTCADAFDNDGDGHTDCADRDCDKIGFCQFDTETTCDDDIDNDADEDGDCDDADCFADPACLVPCASIATPIACSDVLTQVEAGAQAFATHPCAAGDYRVPEVVFTFAPSSTGTAHIGLATLHAHATAFVYTGSCPGNAACEAFAAVPPIDFGEPLAFAFAAGLTYTIVIDAEPDDGIVGPGLVLDRVRLRCE